jgi:hypothetical protein
MIKRAVIFAHRWLGVALCLFFLLWFPSGIGMMYWDFPGVTAADRLEHAAPLEASAVHLSPADAYAVSGLTQPPSQVRLNTFDGRPVYRFRAGRSETIVYADTGERQREVTSEMRARAAAAWAHDRGSARSVETLFEADQWTVQGSFAGQRPLTKFSWPSGEQVYVGYASGEVVQYTTPASRLGAYLGPIPHWLYFTPLRKHQLAWDRVVTWSSGIGTIAAILGIVVGSWMSVSARRIPYRGQKRWHTIIGLIFGLGAATWAFSGMLSMDPLPALTVRPNASVTQALRGRLELAPFAAKHPAAAIVQLFGDQPKELELVVVAGEPVYLATLGQGRTRIVPMSGGPQNRFEPQRLIALAEQASQPHGLAGTALLDQYDRYYLSRTRQRPLPVLLVRVNDADQSRYYIDPKTARVVYSYSAKTWMSRWLYHGLHSLDFPWLYDYRPLWDIVVITFMLGGTALCVTSLILAWRVIGRLITAR